MYAVPAEALDAFWAGLRGHMQRESLAGLPEHLIQSTDYAAHWLDPNLLLSQTCGFPLTTTLAGRVRTVATPCYRAPGCQGPFYSSAVLVRADDPARTSADLRDRRVAFNSTDSQSGYNALRALVAPHAREGRFFAAAIATGAHRSSIHALVTGAADVAAVDAVTLALLRRDHPTEVEGVRMLGLTASAPGLPLITAGATSDEMLAALRRALAAACNDPALAGARAAMLLDGVAVLPADAYAVIPAMAAAAVAQGYPQLA